MSSTPQEEEAKIRQYAHPERLVTSEWLAEHLEDPGVVVIESDEDVTLYDKGHIPGAVKVDWHTDLQDPVTRDYIDGRAFAALASDRGISPDDTLVFYGDNHNWWAAYALWAFSLFGHPDVRLLDGGRPKWEAEGRPLVTDRPARERTEYPVVERHDAEIRAYRDDVDEHLHSRGALIDVRSPEEYRGDVTHMPQYPQEGALRAGHIPGAANVPWKRAVDDDGTFKPVDALRAIYEEEQGLSGEEDVLAYCRIGERSSHTWFVLRHLLGHERVRNYDGSWTEWGNLVRAPIATGDAPGGL